MTRKRTAKKARRRFEAMANKLPSLHQGGTVHVHGDGTRGGIGPLTLEQFNEQQTILNDPFRDLPGGEDVIGVDRAAILFLSEELGVDLATAAGIFGLPTSLRNLILGTGSEAAAGDPFAGPRFELQQRIAEANILNQEHAQAIADQNITLIRQIEQRQAENAQQQFALQEQLARSQNALTQRGQDITQRGQDIGRETSGANILGQLAPALGNLQARRSEFLSQLAANPRDFEQLQLFLGGGTSFLDQLQAGENVPGQSILRGANIPTLGQGFANLLQQVTARPELPLFDQAAQAATQLGQPLAPTPPPTVQSFLNPVEAQTLQEFQAAAPGVPIDTAVGIAQNPGDFRIFAERLQQGQQLKHGGKVVTDEPIVGIGMRSGQPKFTLGEPTAQFPMGAPEMMEVKPLAHGGIVSTQPVSQKLPSPKRPTPTITQPSPRPPTLAAREQQAGFAPGGFDTLQQLNQSVAQARFNRGGESLPQILANPSSGAIQTQQLLGGGPQAPGGIPFGPGSQPGSQTPTLTPSQELFNLQRGLNPSSFANLLPSQLDFLRSRVSRLGVDPRDFLQSVENQFPQGIDPSRIFRASFARGGTIGVVPMVA